MTSKKNLNPLEEHTNIFRFSGWVLLGIPVIVSFLAYFAPYSRGIVIGLLFLLPLILHLPLWLKLRDPAKLRPSLLAGLLLETVVLTGLAFVSLTIAYLSPSDSFFWWLLLLQMTLIGAGLLSGLIKHDAKALQKNQRARHKIEPGHVLIRKRPSAIYGFRKTTGSFLFDWGAKVIYGIYAALTVVGAIFGGAAGLILVQLIGPLPGTELTRHMTGMTLLGLLALPFIGYVLPAFYRTWIGLRRIERAAGHPGAKVTYTWER